MYVSVLVYVRRCVSAFSEHVSECECESDCECLCECFYDYEFACLYDSVFV